MTANTPVTVIVGIASADPRGLRLAAAERVSWGATEVAARFGATTASYDRGVAYFESHGLNVTASPDKLLVVVEGRAESVASAFHTTFEWYSQDGHRFYSHPTPASLPAGIPWTGVLGLGTEAGPRPLASPLARVAVAPAAGCPSSGGITPCNFAYAYNDTGLLTRGVNGTGFTIGVVDTYDANETENSLRADLASFDANFSLPKGHANYLYPVPTTKNLNTTQTGWSYEEALDLQWARAAAPGATIDMTFAPDAFAGLYAAVDWLVAHQSVNVISLSWGEPDVGVYNAFAMPCSNQCNATSDGSYSILGPVFEAAAAEGIGVFAASGDCGAAGGTSGVSTEYPASDPYVTGVGGTVLNLNSSGGYGSETGWSGNSSGASSPGCQNQGGSGGGYSPFPRPSWQSGPGVRATSPRAVPDVSMDAGTGVLVYYHGTQIGLAGTSAATPMWAGAEAVADQYAARSLGFLNPTLYAVAKNSNGTIHDITTGWNGYSAGTGWDPVTGIGTPNLGRLIPRLASGVVTTGNLTVGLSATPTSGTAPLSVAFSATASGGSGPYALWDIAFGDGNASLARKGTVSHTYVKAGSYIATAIVFDSGSNTTRSPPVLIRVGNGPALTVGLNGTPSQPAAGAPVTWTAKVTGGTAPYLFLYFFGDGTYFSTPSLTTTHAYGSAGTFCASVAVTDSSSPAGGGTSPTVSVSVGGSGGKCAGVLPLNGTVAVSPRAVDLPGDINVNAQVSGGTPPFSVWTGFGDAYATQCQCGIFRTAGNHTLVTYINDSNGRSLTRSTTVTLYPALLGSFAIDRASGPAPLSVNFTTIALGGFGAKNYLWSFGDGGKNTSARTTHVYTLPGLYLATGLVSDQGRGNASEAFLIDVTPGSSSSLVLTANVTPAIFSHAGDALIFQASVVGATGTPLIRWDLGESDSAFGPTIQQTYTPTPCLLAQTCPLAIGLSVSDSAGRAAGTTLDLSPFMAGRSSALSLTDNITSLGGPTPFALVARANASGMPGASVSWDFGDGSPAVTGAAVSHSYVTPGNYTLREHATDGWGDVSFRSHALAISGSVLPRPSVTGGPVSSTGFAPYTSYFFVNGSGGSGPPYTYNWTFGDGNRGVGNSVSHTYGSPGRFLANVTVVDVRGTSGLVSFPVRIYQVAQVSIVPQLMPTSGNPGTSARLVVTASVACSGPVAPGCAVVNASLYLSWIPVGFAAAVPALPIVTPNSTGVAVLSVTAPSTPGAYNLLVVTGSPGYAGTGETGFDVTGPLLTSALVILLIAGSVAVAAAIGVVLVRRRGPNRPRVGPPIL